MESHLLAKVSCKVAVQKSGVSINPKLGFELFYLKVNNVAGVAEFSLEPSNRKLNVVGNSNFPSRFRMNNLSKIDFVRAKEGKLVLTLVNYNRNSPDFTESNLKPVHTVVYLSEASVDSLNDLAWKLNALRLKRQHSQTTQDEPQTDKKPHLAPKVEWTRMRRELMKLIMSFAGYEDGQTLSKMRLISKNWNKVICLLSTRVKVVNGVSCPGNLISRILKRNPVVKSLSLENCINFGAKEIKDARSFPLRRLTELNLKGCKKLLSSSIFNLLQMCPDLKFLDLRGCDSADSGLLTGINSRVHLLKLTTLKLGRSFDESCLPHLLTKFKQISNYTLDCITFTDKSVDALASAQLKELHCKISEVQVRRKFPPIEQTNLERLTLVFDESFQSNYRVQCYQAFLNAPNLNYLHINLDPSLLEPYLAFYQGLQELKCVELPNNLPASVKKLTITTKGLLLLIELESRADPGLDGLDELTICTKDAQSATQIASKLKNLYPTLKLRVEVKN
mmetsp:Transcript_19582/g.35937  ORF Transcript_19582/g.35937 Transcript_19582/m.35937 type:complete len:506 (-) Transcript_19582:3100-4617(-)